MKNNVLAVLKLVIKEMDLETLGLLDALFWTFGLKNSLHIWFGFVDSSDHQAHDES